MRRWTGVTRLPERADAFPALSHDRAHFSKTLPSASEPCTEGWMIYDHLPYERSMI
jgi:hypothetical protein